MNLPITNAIPVRVGLTLRYMNFRLVTSPGCKAFFIPKCQYKRALAGIQQRKSSGIIAEYLIIPDIIKAGNRTEVFGAWAFINYQKKSSYDKN